MAKYTYNRDEILKILGEYDKSFTISWGMLYNSQDYKINLTDDKVIEDIKNGKINNGRNLCYTFVVEKLHEYFDKCFPENKPRYSVDKIIDFVEELGFKTDYMGLYYNQYLPSGECDTNYYLMKWCDIVNYLNGNIDNFTLMGQLSYGILTLLECNKDKLLED